MVTRCFVLEFIEVNMILNSSVLIKDPAWGEYFIQVIGFDTEQEQFKVLNGKGKQASANLWQTYDGAAACAELLAEGYFKES
jgi:hypothetical protein